MTDKLLRTFISVTVPKEVVSLQSMLKTTINLQKGDIRWIRRGQIHLTLKFLGHTPPEFVDDINPILKKVVAQHKPMKLMVSGTGCFPDPGRPRVLWLGMDGNTAPLTSLVQDIHAKLEPLGFPLESESFTPHITIARISYPPQWTPDISAFLNTSYEPIPIMINRVRFMASELLPNGAVHSILGTHFTIEESINKESE